VIAVGMIMSRVVVSIVISSASSIIADPAIAAE
jgi:hypothetical protein